MARNNKKSGHQSMKCKQRKSYKKKAKNLFLTQLTKRKNGRIEIKKIKN